MTRGTGGCLCGDVRFTVTWPSLWVAHCHCTLCRRAHGAAYVTWFGMAEDRARIDDAAGSLRWYPSSPGAERGFCARCGSSPPARPEAAAGRRASAAGSSASWSPVSDPLRMGWGGGGVVADAGVVGRDGVACACCCVLALPAPVCAVVCGVSRRQCVPLCAGSAQEDPSRGRTICGGFGGWVFVAVARLVR